MNVGPLIDKNEDTIHLISLPLWERYHMKAMLVLCLQNSVSLRYPCSRRSMPVWSAKHKGRRHGKCVAFMSCDVTIKNNKMRFTSSHVIKNLTVWWSCHSYMHNADAIQKVAHSWFGWCHIEWVAYLIHNIIKLDEIKGFRKMWILTISWSSYHFFYNYISIIKLVLVISTPISVNSIAYATISCGTSTISYKVVPVHQVHCIQLQRQFTPESHLCICCPL